MISLRALAITFTSLVALLVVSILLTISANNISMTHAAKIRNDATTANELVFDLVLATDEHIQHSSARSKQQIEAITKKIIAILESESFSAQQIQLMAVSFNHFGQAFAELERRTAVIESVDDATKNEALDILETQMRINTHKIISVTEKIIEDSEAQNTETLRANMVRLLVIAGLIFIVALTSILMFYVALMKPLNGLAEAAKQIKGGNLHFQIKKRGIKELRNISTEFNSMTEELSAHREHLEKMVTERTAELEKTNKKVLAKEKKISHLKDRFVFVAAHELRAPTTALRWELENMKNSLKDDQHNKDVKASIKLMGESVNNLTNLVNDLLDTSRLESGTIELNPTQCNPNEILEDVVNQLAGLAKKAKIKLDVDKAKVKNVTIDRQRTIEIITNLIGNAIKYNLAGGTVNGSIKQTGNKTEFVIRDDGLGFAAADAKKLFKKFSRLKYEETQDINGTGLGLFISRQLAKQMEGTITAKSPGKGKGATFTLTLPNKID